MINEQAFQRVGEVLNRKDQPSQLTLTEQLFSERITPEMELDAMEPLFVMNGVPCFFRGELVADCGKAKSGKTTLLSIIMAACLKQEVLSLQRKSEAPLRVLWIDTEQSQQSTQEVMRKRILPLVDTPPSNETPPAFKFNEQFFAFNLRGIGYEKRKQLISLAIRSVKPDLAIIDGIKDLMTDINDAVQSTVLMEQLMALAQESKSCIVCVLHQNKSEFDHNMRGSIGTELTNKAFEVFQCDFIEEGEVFKVTQTYSRHRKMKHKFYYRLSDEGLPVVCTGYQEQPRDANGRWVAKADSEALKKLFKEAMEGRNQRPYNELMAVALKKCGVADAKTYYANVETAVSLGIIRLVQHPENSTNWVELCGNELPF